MDFWSHEGFTSPSGVTVGVGAAVVGVHPGMGVQNGSFEPKGRIQTWQLVVTVCPAGRVETALVFEVLEVIVLGTEVVRVGDLVDRTDEVVELVTTPVVILVEVTELRVTEREADPEVALRVRVTGSGLIPGGRGIMVPAGGGAVRRVQTELDVLEDELVEVALRERVTGSGLIPGGRGIMVPTGGGVVRRVQTGLDVLEDELVGVELEDDNLEEVTEVRKLVGLEGSGWDVAEGLLDGLGLDGEGWLGSSCGKSFESKFPLKSRRSATPFRSGKVTDSAPAAAAPNITGSASPRIEKTPATGAAPAARDGRPRPARSANGSRKNPKAAVWESSFLLWTITGLALALANAAFTIVGSMVGVVPVNVDVTGRKGGPPDWVVVTGNVVVGLVEELVEAGLLGVVLVVELTLEVRLVLLEGVTGLLGVVLLVEPVLEVGPVLLGGIMEMPVEEEVLELLVEVEFRLKEDEGVVLVEVPLVERLLETPVPVWQST
jgi:hypothetical protein